MMNVFPLIKRVDLDDELLGVYSSPDAAWPTLLNRLSVFHCLGDAEAKARSGPPRDDCLVVAGTTLYLVKSMKMDSDNFVRIRQAK